MQTAALVRGNKLPLFFNDTLIDRYQRATVNFYETGEFGPYVDFFKENHALAIAHLLGLEPENLLSESEGEIQLDASKPKQLSLLRE